MRNDFITKAIKKHNNTYDYSNVEYKNSKTKVKIFCKTHGLFEQIPSKHLFGQGCPKCGLLKRFKSKTKTTEDFIKKSNIIHNGKFDYSNVIYIHGKKKIDIICNNGHLFKQTPNSHLCGHGCPICKGNKIRISESEFYERLLIIHGNFYGFSKVKHETMRNKIKVICPEHGEFEIKTYSLLEGHGCPKCKYWKSETKLYNKIKVMFPNEKIERQFTPKWLGRQRFDIFFPNHNIAVEYNGYQHYYPVKIFGGFEGYIKTVERDLNKKMMSFENNCLIFDFPYFLKKKEITDTLNKLKNKIEEHG